MKKQKIHIIAGSTASGKSSCAMDLARQNNGLIINADSMQIYDALPILTAQPTIEDKQEIEHRLYAYLHPNDKCSAQIWRDLAIIEIERAFEIGKQPILVGGTGFYIRTLVEGVSPVPDVPDEIRQDVTKLQSEMGNPAFHAELSKIDPVICKKLDPNDTQRLIRAYEVFEATGKPLSYWQTLPLEGAPKNMEFDLKVIALPRDVLRERCAKRFDEMIDQGIIDEVKALNIMIDSGEVASDALVTHALGFHPINKWLSGDISKDEAIERSKIETRQYAKRQSTWFKNQFKN